MGPVNILVNNAAQMRRMVTIAKTNIDDWDNEVKLCLSVSKLMHLSKEKP
jgi:NADP-dependent 3-hydroxy acid dehydrogenase YdfG